MLEESASALPSSIWASMNSWFTPTILFVLLNLVIGTIAFTSSLANQKKQQQQNHKHSQNDPHQPNNIAKSPSLLHRLKSINFYSHHRSQEPQNSNLTHTHQPQPLESQSHYFFQDDSYQENQNLANPRSPQITNSQTHEENIEKTRAHLDFEQKDSNFDVFHHGREEKKAVDESGEQTMDEVYSEVTGGHFSRTKSDTSPSSGEIPTKLPARMRKSASLKSAFGHFEEEEVVETRRPATVREKGSAKVTDGDEEVDAKADDFINRFKQQLKLQRLDSIIRYKDMIGRGIGGK